MQLLELAFEDLEMPGQHLPAPDAPEQVRSAPCFMLCCASCRAPLLGALLVLHATGDSMLCTCIAACIWGAKRAPLPHLPTSPPHVLIGPIGPTTEPPTVAFSMPLQYAALS